MPEVNIIDIFSDDAFSLVAMTDAVNNIPHVPGQAGEPFAGAARGIQTTKVAVELKDTALSLIQTTPRGAPAPQEVRDKRKVIELSVPHIQLEETILASSVQDVRGFGTDALAGVEQVVNEQQAKMVARMDMTTESLRLGALKGEIRDADGSVIVNLYDAFGVTEPDTVDFAASGTPLRTICLETKRKIEKAVKMVLPATARVKALCSAPFFDTFISHDDVKATYDNYEAAATRLGGDVRAGFEFGGIVFEEYRGTDGVTGEEASDGELVGEVGIAAGECRFFLTGVPGLFDEVFAPADFMEFVNTVGLPRYSKVVVDPQMARYALLHVQSNPLPMCKKPLTLLRGTF